MNLRLNWITLRVHDLEASLQFYNQVLGLPIKRRFESRGKQIAMLSMDGQAKLELIQGSEQVMKPECGISLGFEVESLDKAMIYLETKGIPVARGPIAPNPHLTFFYILDPDGFEIQLAEHNNK